ncbi:MAG: site-specific integrase [Reichenbachiella sp.]|uniref:Phage integrase family protein n=1 Tax=Reichenbachiella faecimaris TaxID=692418 RepID=A0A1W2G5B8_REIFA|nr:site-specific integrase [Reichenbachiella faecimaris]SMD31793.1 Phage integrase family protein [Reichenbachiella faecimaris]
MSYVKTISFQENYKLPVLFINSTSKPSYYYFEYLLFKLRYAHPLSTLRDKAYAVSKFYNYAHQNFNQNIDALIKKNSSDELEKILNAYKIYILNTQSKQEYSNKYRYVLLKALRDFIEYYVQSRSLTINLLPYNSIFSKLRIETSTKFKKSNLTITKEYLEIVLQVVSPESELNPYHPDLGLRWRNYIIIRILYETGIRLGELMSLDLNSYFSSNKNYYLSIGLSDKINDTRFSTGLIKNPQSVRNVAISDELHSIIHHYVTVIRRKVINLKEHKQQFLIVSNRARSISKHTIYQVLNKAQDKANILNNSSYDLKPHAFRYAFANSFLKYLIEIEQCSLELAKDKLRSSMGWDSKSTMPDKYAANYIAQLADQDNIKRLNSIY